MGYGGRCGSLSNTLSHSQVHWHLYEFGAVRKVMAMYHLHVHQYGSFLPPFFCIFKGDEKALCCHVHLLVCCLYCGYISYPRERSCSDKPTSVRLLVLHLDKICVGKLVGFRGLSEQLNVLIHHHSLLNLTPKFVKVNTSLFRLTILNVILRVHFLI